LTAIALSDSINPLILRVVANKNRGGLGDVLERCTHE